MAEAEAEGAAVVATGAGVIEATTLVEGIAGVAVAGIVAAGIEEGTGGAANVPAAQRTYDNYEYLGNTSGRSFTHLANVEVCAVWVDLRVVCVEHGRVDTVVRRDDVAVVIGLNNVGCCAVLTGQTETECVTDLEIVATCVNLRVDNCQLVPTGS